MILTLHGTGAGEPSGDRLASALTARFSDSSLVLFDAGEGCSRAMIRDGVDLMDITTVAISHMHADHWAGLPNLIMAWAVAKRKTPVHIHLPPKSGEFFERMLAIAYNFSERRSFTITHGILSPFSLPDGWRAEIFATTHLDSVKEYADMYGVADTAYGYRLLNGSRKIIFSQDIGSEEDLAMEMTGAELVICEAAHVEPAKVLAMARERGVRRLVFTHVPPREVSFPGTFDGIEWSVAADGYLIEL